MILVTDDLRERLLANGRNRGADHVPVVKFFNPSREGVRLATELDAGLDGGLLMPLSCTTPAALFTTSAFFERRHHPSVTEANL